MMYSLARIYASFFGVGFSRFAPGTLGSLAACIPAVWLNQLNLTVQILILILSYILGQLATEIIHQHQDEKDPSWVVIDEVCGVWLIVIVIQLLQPLPYISLFFVASMVLFRFFDIKKPWPVNYIDSQKTPWAVMFDDIVAAAMALIVTYALMGFVPSIV